MLTRDELVYRLNYDPDTGVLRWRNPPKTAPQKPDDKAGYLDKENYLMVMINYKYYRAAILIWLYMTGDWPNGEIDHIDGNRLNNKWKNLREVSRSQNSQNQKIPSNNTSGEKGVIWHKNKKMWIARVIANKKVYDSCHHYWWQAVKAARRRREWLHGEYCRHR